MADLHNKSIKLPSIKNYTVNRHVSQIENMFYNIFSLSSEKNEKRQCNKKVGWHATKLRRTNQLFYFPFASYIKIIRSFSITDLT